MPSGERTSYETRSWAPTAAQHRAAYRFAAKYAQGRRVVEIGCGVGFGARILSQQATQVLAIDNSPDAISACEKDPPPANLLFRRADALSLSRSEITCDVLVAFQVIEHLADTDRFLRLAAEATAPDGICLISTPNALLSVGNNPYHHREYTPAELQGLLVHHFPSVEVLGVKGSERALQYHARRRRLVRSILSADVLRVRRLLPRKITQRLADYLGAAVKRILILRKPRAEADDWEHEYSVGQRDLDKALDLMAICRHRERE